VTQRTREIGLRRAKGATRERIRRQVLGEILVMTTLAVLPAAVLLAQLPLVAAVDWIEPHVWLVALAVSLGAIYVLALICGWYPARLATAVEPAEALRYE
jgi:putative ABC transport system permease protein